MAIVPRNVTLLTTVADNVELVDVLGFNGQPITLVPGVATDLLALAADEDLAKSQHLANLNADGLLTVNSTFDTAQTQATASGIITRIVSGAGAGGAATEVMTLTGLLTTDTILGVTQVAPGGNNLALIGWTGLATDAMTMIWAADPGAGAVVVVLVQR